MKSGEKVIEQGGAEQRRGKRSVEAAQAAARRRRRCGSPWTLPANKLTDFLWATSFKFPMITDKLKEIETVRAKLASLESARDAELQKNWPLCHRSTAFPLRWPSSRR